MRWYSWLYAPAEMRPLVAAAFALEKELQSVADARVDHGVAHLKLQWWREELFRLEQGQPRHPLTRAAMDTATDRGPAWRLFQDLLSSLELDLACSTYETEAELDRYFALAAGMQRAIADLLVSPDERTARFAGAAGQSIRGVEIIRDLREDALRGRIYLPLAWLDAESVDHKELRAGQLSPGILHCLARLAEKSRKQGQRAREALAGHERPALRGQRVLLGLHLALLDRMESAKYEVGREQHALAPMQSLWTAWRAARQH